ncbi:25742_t:CDS:2, partial [Racocetra persica]
IVKKKPIESNNSFNSSLNGSTLNIEDKRPKILLNLRIPVNDIDQICNPKSDSNCRFWALAIAIQRNEKNWNLVKLAINSQLNKRIEIYKDWLDYAQLAVNTFSVPIAVFDKRDE